MSSLSSASLTLDRIQTLARTRLASVVMTLMTLAAIGTLDGQAVLAVHAAAFNYVPAGCTSVHVVRRGETFARIAGRNWVAVARHDGIPDANRIWPNERICVAWRGSPAPTRAVNASPVHVTVTSSSPNRARGVGLALEPCSVNIPSSVWSVNYHYAWQAPAGCYGTVYTPNAHNYVSRSGFGWCNWWAEVTRPDEPTLLRGDGGLVKTTVARPGETMVFAGGVQGASRDGHYAHVEAISPDGRVALISEMNFTWRGAGFGRVNYRFVTLGPGISFWM